ncbi:MAG: transposase [Casimicrobiaceae bacterium]
MVVDPVRQRIVWVGAGKSSDTLGELFKALGPERAKLLTHVTMELSAAYRSSVSEHAPQAELVFDRFHIQRLASDAVDAVRRGEVRSRGRRDRPVAQRNALGAAQEPVEPERSRGGEARGPSARKPAHLPGLVAQGARRHPSAQAARRRG